MLPATRSTCVTLGRGESAFWARLLSAVAAGPSPLQQVPVTVTPEGEPTLLTAPSEAKVARAVYRQLRISSKKLTPVAKLVRRMAVEDALLQCDLLSKKAALMVQNAIRSARANGVHNHGMDGKKLYVDECFATNGHNLKRIKIHGKGKFGKMLRRRSHLTVILKEDGKPRPSPHKIQPTWLERATRGERKRTGADGPPRKRELPMKWKWQLGKMRKENQLARKDAKEKARLERRRSQEEAESQDTRP